MRRALAVIARELASTVEGLRDEPGLAPEAKETVDAALAHDLRVRVETAPSAAFLEAAGQHIGERAGIDEGARAPGRSQPDALPAWQEASRGLRDTARNFLGEIPGDVEESRAASRLDKMPRPRDRVGEALDRPAAIELRNGIASFRGGCGGDRATRPRGKDPAAPCRGVWPRHRDGAGAGGPPGSPRHGARRGGRLARPRLAGPARDGAGPRRTGRRPVQPPRGRRYARGRRGGPPRDRPVRSTAHAGARHRLDRRCAAARATVSEGGRLEAARNVIDRESFEDDARSVRRTFERQGEAALRTRSGWRRFRTSPAPRRCPGRSPDAAGAGPAGHPSRPTRAFPTPSTVPGAGRGTEFDGIFLNNCYEDSTVV